MPGSSTNERTSWTPCGCVRIHTSSPSTTTSKPTAAPPPSPGGPGPLRGPGPPPRTGRRSLRLAGPMSTIGGYRFGHVLVDDRGLARDVIVLPNRVIENWWRREGHELAWVDLEDVAEELPERLIVGTGADQRMQPDPDVLDRLQER